MATYDPERVNQDLDTATSILTSWMINLDLEDGAGRQHIHKHQLESPAYLDAACMIKAIVEGVQPEQMLQLKMGATAAEAVNFQPNAYDLGEMHFSKLDVDSELDLRKADFVKYSLGEIREELFVGFFYKMALSEVAKTLIDGGELSLLGTARPMPASR